MKRIFSISILMFCLPFFLFAQSASSGNGGQRADGYEYVDLGLSVKWATCNVGASSPEDVGGYYQWAGTRDVTSKNINLEWDNCPYHSGADRSSGWTKYVTSNKSSYWSGRGNPDNKTVLDPGDDVAQVRRGGKWRIPTETEWEELQDCCTWTRTTQNGVEGIKVTSKKSGYTNRSIFLPVTGYRSSNSLLSGFNFISNDGCYWSSSCASDTPSASCFIIQLPVTSSSKASRWSGGCVRYYGMSVRPVYGDPINVTGVSLDKTRINLNVGATYTLKATVTPSNAPDQTVSWSSSNTDVATVSQSGKVFIIDAGSATISVKANDGGCTATCSITVTEPTPEAVDLGLSVKWATCNIGASKPEQYGKYYAWGSVAGLAQKSTEIIGNFSGKGGFPRNTDYKLNKDLSPEYDAAHVKYGGKWRMPTEAEFEELINNCKVVWTTVNGVHGSLFTSKKPGHEGKSIFLPAAGTGVGSLLSSDGFNGNYWSSTVYDDNSAYSLDIDSDDVGTYFISRFFGCSIRPVLEY